MDPQGMGRGFLTLDHDQQAHPLEQAGQCKPRCGEHSVPVNQRTFGLEAQDTRRRVDHHTPSPKPGKQSHQRARPDGIGPR
jgi:hypothetical protein